MNLSQTFGWLGLVLILLEIAGGQHCAQLGGGEGIGLADEAIRNDEQEWAFCPYDFGAPMPPGVYCVYSGRVLDPNGATCVEDAGVLWSSFDPKAQATPARPIKHNQTIHGGSDADAHVREPPPLAVPSRRIDRRTIRCAADAQRTGSVAGTAGALRQRLSSGRGNRFTLAHSLPEDE